MEILSVIFGFVIILDGKLGTAVQATQAHGAVFLGPGGLAVPHFDGIHRAVLSAQAAANTGIFHMEVTCFAQSLIEAGVDQLHGLA